ncbi:MAG: hypothetical protein WBA99_02030 [Nodosilinea sp.]
MLLLALGIWGWGGAAAAGSLCQNVGAQRVCIETINRSAKYAWEYRVVVSVDDQRCPLKRYDCRPEVQLKEATTAPDEADIRAFVCGLVTH